MDDWKAETGTFALFPGRTRSMFVEVVGAAMPIDNLPMFKITVGKSVPLAAGSTMILYGEWFSSRNSIRPDVHMLK